MNLSRCRSAVRVALFALVAALGLIGPTVFASSRHAPVKGSPGAPLPRGPFQIAFVTRLESASFNEDFSVYIKAGKAESLQASVPGVPMGSYVERILLTAGETDPARGRFKVRETLKTDGGTLTWEAIVRVIDSAEPLLGEVLWAPGTITKGTGLFKGAAGNVEISGRLAACDPVADSDCVAYADDPTTGQRQDVNIVVRGVMP